MAWPVGIDPGIDPGVPSPARIYDYCLGGKDNFAADREAAEKALSLVPQGREVARSNRRFLIRAVRYMASHGVAQFIDLGTGFPTPPSVHETAAALVDGPRVVYFDNDPMVTCHNRALLAGDQDGVAVLHGDIRCPGQILKQDDLWKTIDFGRPVGVLLVAVLHFIPGEDDPQGSVSAFCSLMAPVSFLAISHITSDGTGPAMMAANRGVPDSQRACGVPEPGRDRGILRWPGLGPARDRRGIRVARQREPAAGDPGCAPAPRRRREKAVSQGRQADERRGVRGSGYASGEPTMTDIVPRR
jgi:hypothetical protein